jgi:predicted transcriptional regulator
MQHTALTRDEIYAVFGRHPMSQKAIAEALGVRAASVSQWLAGRMGSKRIEAACRELALELLDKEKTTAAA